MKAADSVRTYVGDGNVEKKFGLVYFFPAKITIRSTVFVRTSTTVFDTDTDSYSWLKRRTYGEFMIIRCNPS